MDAQNLAGAAAEHPAQGWEWIIVAEEDWPGVNDCGAICAPDRGMRFEIDDEEWLGWSSC